MCLYLPRVRASVRALTTATVRVRGRVKMKARSTSFWPHYHGHRLQIPKPLSIWTFFLAIRPSTCPFNFSDARIAKRDIFTSKIRASPSTCLTTTQLYHPLRRLQAPHHYLVSSIICLCFISDWSVCNLSGSGQKNIATGWGNRSMFC